MTDSSVLLQLGQSALQHQEQLEEVKRRMGIAHNYFDCWVYGFLENKNFDVEETVAKLIRRDTMERNELANYDITDYMRETMAKGIIQLIGDDKEGRVTFYIVTKRDFPTAKRREENKRNFDMWLSYGTRLRKENQTCRITMLINQTDASMWSNTDMTFQADVALRIAKYYPGAVDRMYICKMNRTLAAVAKPIFARLPKVVSDRIRIFTESDLAKGRLLELFDEDVLPVALGGKNTCDGPTNWNQFTDTITRHFTSLKSAVQNGKGVKEYELEMLRAEIECCDSISQTGSENGSAPTVVAQQAAQRLDQQALHLQASALHVQHHATPERSIQLFADGDAAGMDISDTRTLLTCNSEASDYEMDALDHHAPDGAGHSAARNQSERHIEEWSRNTIRRSLSMTQAADAAGLLEMHEATFRATVAEMEAMEVLTIVERFVPYGMDNAASPTEHLLFGSQSIMQHFPRPLRSVIRGTLWVVCVIMAFYFLIATLFAAAVGCSMMTAFFFSMYAAPYNVYPFGFALLVTGYQTSMICARGYELVRTSFRGRMFHCLRPLGPRRGLQVQALLFVLITAALFVVFCKYASDNDPVVGIQYSVACGWVICSAFVLLYHVLFLIGLRGDPLDCYHTGEAQLAARSGNHSQHFRNQNIAGFSLYLFLDVTEQYDDVDTRTRKAQASYVLYAAIPILIATLSGIAFMINANQVFLIGCLAATTASGFLVNFLTEGDSWDHCATLIRLVVSFSAVSWLYIVLSIGFFGTSGGWGGSMALLLVAMLVWMLLALGSAKYSEGARRRQWCFRLGWLIFVAHLVVSLVMLFIDTYRAGIFVLALCVHSSISFFRYGASSKVGTLTASVGFLALVIATAVIGLERDATARYSVPLSEGPLQNFSYGGNSIPLQGQGVLGTDYSTPEYTACLSRFPNTLDLVAMSIFSAITYAADETTKQKDLRAIFPTFQSIPSNRISPALQLAIAGSFIAVDVFEDASVENVTVVALSNRASDPFGLMDAMTMWVEAMAVAPIGMIIPEEWTASVVKQMSKVVTDIVPLRWKAHVNHLSDALMAHGRQYALNKSSSHRLYIVGHDVNGGVASIVGARSDLRTVTFGAPGMLFSNQKFGFPSDKAVDRRVIPVIAESSTLGLIGGLSPKAVKLVCEAKTDRCRLASYYVQRLQDACYPSV